MDFLYETPTLEKEDFINLPTDVWFSPNIGNHNDVRIKFKDRNSKLIPLRIDVEGIKLDNKYVVNSLEMDSKNFYNLCDWFICNRDIINFYANCNNITLEIDMKTKELLQQRDKDISDNKSKFMIPYKKEKYGCKFLIPQQIPVNVELQNISLKLNECLLETEFVNDILINAGLKEE